MMSIFEKQRSHSCELRKWGTSFQNTSPGDVQLQSWTCRMTPLTSTCAKAPSPSPSAAASSCAGSGLRSSQSLMEGLSSRWRETPSSKEPIVRKKPTLELPQYVHRVFNSAGHEYFYFQRGRGSSSPQPRIRLPKGPHTPEFWAAYQHALGSEPLSGKTFDDLINAYKVSPEYLKRAEATRRDYVRYLDIISKA